MRAVDIKDSDSDDDIFVVKQIKPVNKLTLQQALIIKYGVLTSLSSKKPKNKKKKKDKVRDKSDNSVGVSESQRDSQRGKAVASKTLKKESSETDCAEIKSSVKSNKEISSKVLRKSNSKNVKRDLDPDPPEKERQRCSLKSEITRKSKGTSSPSGSPGILGKCLDQKEENYEKSPNIKRKRKKLEIIETNQNENEVELPMKISNVPKENENANEGTVKSEIKLEEHLGFIEDACFENVVKLKEFSDGYSSKFPVDRLQTCLLHAVNSFEGLQEETFKNNNELLSFLLKKIVCNETKKQLYLEQESKNVGKIVEKLLSETDCLMLQKFFNLNQSAAQVFVRMLGRKKCWHRVSNINYSDISDNLEHEFQILFEENFVDINIEDEDIKTQLNLLSKPEVLQVCRNFNIFLKSVKVQKKGTLIDLIIEDNKKQKSVSDVFKKTASTKRFDLLKSQVKRFLGMCIKLSDKAFEAFYKIIILHSFPHYTEEEGKRFSHELYMSIQVHNNLIRFPNYKLSPTVVFDIKSDFDEYKKALMLYNSFEIASTDKNHEEFIILCNKAKEEFIRLLRNNEYLERFLNLKPFLRKFSAGTVYARILSKYCKIFKKNSTTSDRIKIAQLLLDQNLFLTGKKGEWYETLAKDLENEKKCQAAAEIIIKSLGDPHVNEVQRLTLQLRGQSILRKKNSGLTDGKLRELLDDICTLSVQEPPSIEIKGRSLSMDNPVSKKSIYIQNCKNGKMYTSVEERALSHYKSVGFTKGYHVEGFIVQSIYILLFYDIIYTSSVEGVFQSPYQEAPLDFYSELFYDNRKEEIDLLLGDMMNWNDQEMEARIKDVYNRNYMTTCLIKWDDQFTPDLFCEVIKCITVPILVLILQRLISNFRVFRSGFPDLTLWNPQTKKCKFVEVKSPNDRLSDAQRVWLHYLRSIGLDCEVCKVKNFSGKSFE